MALALPLAAQEQESQITPFEFERNADYESSIRFRRVQSELIYIDRLVGEIPMDGVRLDASEPDPTDPQASPELELGSRVVLALVALALLGLLYVNRRKLALLLGRTPQNPASQAPQNPRAGAAPVEADPALIARLRGMADRQAALVLLIRAVLETAASANGLRLGRSETAREFLRRLPLNWAHLVALRRLVMAEELVQFGGRPLAQETFEACLSQATPILRSGGHD